jgi:hypothetical protein
MDRARRGRTAEADQGAASTTNVTVSSATATAAELVAPPAGVIDT